MTINERIELIVKAKASSRKEFASTIGWSIEYLNKLLHKGQGVGVKPITQIVETFPDIDANWLLTGAGFMFGSVEGALTQQYALRVECAKYIAVMSEKEVAQFLGEVNASSFDQFLRDNKDKWSEMLNRAEADRIMYDAILLKNNLCKPKTP